jgi:hypothetical protein
MTISSTCCRVLLSSLKTSNMISSSTCSYPLINRKFIRTCYVSAVSAVRTCTYLFYSFYNFSDSQSVLRRYTFLSARLCTCKLEIVLCMCAIFKIVNPDIICQKSVPCLLV